MRNKLNIRGLYILLLIIITSCSRGDDNTIRIAYLPITHALPLAEMSGAEGVKVELVKYGSWPELLDALNTGRVDGASVLIELAMKAKSQGIGLTTVALGHTDGNVIIVTSEAQNIASLKGKTFAIPHRTSSHYILLQKALEKEGLSVTDVNIVEMSPPEMPSALSGGQISGYCVAEPFGAVAIVSGKGRVLYRSEELWPHSICCGLVINNRSYKKKQQQMDRFIAEYKAAGKRLEDKSHALQTARKILAQPDGVLKQSLEWIDYTNLQVTREAYVILEEEVKKYGIIDNPPTYEDFIK